MGNDLKLTGAGQSLVLTQGITINTIASSETVDVRTTTLAVNAFNYGADVGSEDKQSILGLTASANQDASIRFAHGTTAAWRIGNDATDDVFKFESGASALGTSPELQIAAGTLTAVGDIVAGDDIAVAATGKFKNIIYKQFCTFGSGNITDMNLIFPDMSGNFVLLLKQDGSGSREVANWKTFDQDQGNESTVKWAGGSAPTLTTAASKTDILSFYWDNANHTAYGVATLNF